MTLLALGLNHSTAPLEIREKVTISSEVLPQALTELTSGKSVNEAAILSTCNRTEIYCDLEAANSDWPLHWFSDFHGCQTDELRQFIYRHPDDDAVKHILRVASGLDSLLVGEPQVLGQLKQAYNIAVRTGSIGKLLGRLFQYSFRVAKQIRSDTGISRHPVSVAYAAVRLAQQIFGDLGAARALLVGSGEMIELSARHLHDNGLEKIIIANRTLERAQELAGRYAAVAISLNDIPKYLDEADIIISCTASPLPILGKGAIETALKKRKHRPMFIADIAVPRDIEPEADELEDVYLYTVDDLKDVVDENLLLRRQAALEAEAIIDTQVSEFMEWINSLQAVAAIRAIREQADDIQQQVLTLALQKLQQGHDPTLVLREATRSLSNKLIHKPSINLNKISGSGDEKLLQAAQELFDLPAADAPDDEQK
ncbi:MAG: glutamyl-tRNA reductase [Gammaproteobacteria bacterium]